ncbi:hypothetical protein [Micromonospora sp. WMMD1274]|uniref:hypothetical protein n=1 Tax=Micromonospora sp. WMMD1274 TaxID=3404116 RepID=UPI003B9399F0
MDSSLRSARPVPIGACAPWLGEPTTGVAESETGAPASGVPEAGPPETGGPETGLRESGIPGTGALVTGLAEAGTPDVEPEGVPAAGTRGG